LAREIINKEKQYDWKRFGIIDSEKEQNEKKKMNRPKILSFGLRLIKSNPILSSREKSSMKKRLILWLNQLKNMVFCSQLL